MNKKKITPFLVFLFSIILLSIVAWIIKDLTINRKSVLVEWFALTLILLLNFFVVDEKNNNSRKKVYILQLYVPICFFTLFWDLAFFSKYTNTTNVISWYGLLCLNLLLLTTTRFLTKNHNLQFYAQEIINFFKYNYGLILICLLFIIGSIEIFYSWLNEDGIQYYSQITKIKNWDFLNLSYFKLAGHHSELFTVIMMIGEFIFPNSVYGVRLILLICALLSIFAFYNILDILYKNESKTLKLILTATYAFSPFLYGIFGEINLDFPLICIFTWIYLFYLKKLYILQFFSMLLICFTKETGCVIYGLFVLGEVINCIILSRHNHDKFVANFIENKLLFKSFPGIIWILYYVISQFALWGNSAISSSVNDNGVMGYLNNTFDVWPQYFFYRLKQIFTFNYQWVFTLVIITLTIAIMLSRRKSLKSNFYNYIPLIFSGIGIIIINTFYVTYTHVRYISPFMLCCMIAYSHVIVNSFSIKKIKVAITCIILGITIIANYSTDFLTLKIFLNYNVGNGYISCPRLFSVDENGVCIQNDSDNKNYSLLNEGIAYNRQFTGRGYVIEDLLKKIDYQEGDLIIIPDVFHDEYMVYRNALLRGTAWKNSLMLWNTESKRTNANSYFIDSNNFDKNEWIAIKTQVISEYQNIDLNDYARVFYIELPFNLDYDHENFLKNYEIKDEYVSSKNVWKFKAYRIK